MAPFRLYSPGNSLLTEGVRRELPRGPIGSLAVRASAFLSAAHDGPALLVGALPFDRDADDFLFQPETVIPAGEDGQVARSRRIDDGGNWLISTAPDAADYARAVTRALEAIAADHGRDALRKVVLSRSLDLLATSDIDVEALFAHLRNDPSVTAFRTPVPGGEGERANFVGATPELLVSRHGESVVSHPLAGSARRYADPAADRRSASALESSDKDRREHELVVEAVLDTLAPYCRELGVPDGTTLRPTGTMWHLGTRIAGRLRDRGTPVTELAAALHPTPAVCGLPRERAARLIAGLEGYDRGFYAGAVGWTDAEGDGEWYVALRCARIAGRRARLYAGAGIVPGSDPLAEVDETSAKFVAMLDALGVDEQGRVLSGRAA